MIIHSSHLLLAESSWYLLLLVRKKIPIVAVTWFLNYFIGTVSRNDGRHRICYLLALENSIRGVTHYSK